MSRASSSPSRRRSLRLSFAALATAIAIAMAATACGSGSGTSGGTSSTSSSSSGEKRVHIVTVNAPANDPFVSAWKKGTDQAAKDLGVDSEWLAPNDLNNPGPDLAALEQTAVAKHPDALIVGDFLPDSQTPGILAAIKAGIPTWEANGGAQFSWERDGAFGWFGSDAVKQGEMAGKLLAQAGVKHGLCINHVPGNTGTEAECKGFARALAAAGASSKVMTITSTDATNPAAVTQALNGVLSADKAIDGVFTLGSGVATYALKTLKDANLQDKVKLGTSDISTAVLNSIKAGEVQFALDQQPYMQGYLSVLAATTWVRYGMRPVGIVATGPLAIDKDNVQSVLDAQGSGIRGAT